MAGVVVARRARAGRRGHRHASPRRSAAVGPEGVQPRRRRRCAAREPRKMPPSRLRRCRHRRRRRRAVPAPETALVDARANGCRRERPEAGQRAARDERVRRAAVAPRDGRGERRSAAPSRPSRRVANATPGGSRGSTAGHSLIREKAGGAPLGGKPQPPPLPTRRELGPAAAKREDRVQRLLAAPARRARNSGRNAERARGYGRKQIQQSTCRKTHNNTHIWAEGVGGGSRGSRRGRRRGTRGKGGAATTTTRRRGASRAPPPPFPWRWRSPGLFLSSRGEGRMDPDPEGDKEGEGGIGGNKGIGNANDANKNVGAGAAGRPEHSRAGDAVAGGVGKGAAAGEAA